MPLLDKFATEDELIEELRKRTGKGSKRQLRNWRVKRTGPPWRYLGKTVIYPHHEFSEWLHAGIVLPVQPRRTSSRSR